MMDIVLLSVILLLLVIGFVLMIVGIFSWKRIFKKIVTRFFTIVMTDPYQENLLELLAGMNHMGWQKVFENNLRADTGTVLFRPLGSQKKWPHLESITFIPAQTGPFCVDAEQEVDVQVTLGPKAKKPLKLQIPLIISGMAYGIALSEKARIALATAASRAGTAINSGEGGILPEELQAADKFILQFGKTAWSKEEEVLKRADMIELKFGQGALGAVGARIPPKDLPGRAREIMGLKEGEDAVIYDTFFENPTLRDIKEMVDSLRSISKGVPIGAKIMAGGRIEEDIDHLLEAGVDVIAVDGGQAATLGAPPIMSDDFGIPTMHGVYRAAQYLRERGVKDRITLIASGGLFTPGEFLKVLALGADAVYLGTAALFSLTHKQILKSLPWEPPTQVVWNDGKFKEQFDLQQGINTVYNFLNACAEEMKVGLRAMGKTSLSELSINDLVSYDQHVAKMLGIPYTFEPLAPERV
jgi:glutamate synthase domain-containing protein 2